MIISVARERACIRFAQLDASPSTRAGSRSASSALIVRCSICRLKKQDLCDPWTRALQRSGSKTVSRCFGPRELTAYMGGPS
jgi:hypothetical protein